MSLPRFPEYKESSAPWLGVVPSHWALVRVKDVAHVVMGQSPSSDTFNESGLGIPFLQGNADFGSTSPDARYFSTAATKFAERGDILLSVRAPVGAINVADQGYGIGRGLCALRAREGVVSAFLRYAAEVSKEGLFSVATGSTYEAVSVDQVASVAVVRPPPGEQVAIANFLDRETNKIDALIAEQEKLIALVAEKRQATMSHAVTRGINPDAAMKDSGEAWLGAVPAHWEVVGLTKYIESVVDYRGRTPTKVDQGVFLVTAKNIRDGRIDYDASQEYIDPGEYESVMRRGQPMKGDVLFTTEAPLGQVALVDREDVALAQRIIKFRVDRSRLSAVFLKFWIMSSACQFNLEQLATGSTALGIKGSKVGQIRLCLPPLSEQQDIIRYIEAEIAKLEVLQEEAGRAVALLKERRGALIAAAVTGQIDVRGGNPVHQAGEVAAA